MNGRFAALVISAWMILQGVAHADTVLYDSPGFIQGQQSYTQSFDITTPGTLTVSLSDIPWLDTISNLSGFVSTASGMMGKAMTDGTESFNVQPGMVYTHWYGDADGTYGVGAYGLKVTFRPAGSPATAVPVASSLIFMATGIAVLLTWRKRGGVKLADSDNAHPAMLTQ